MSRASELILEISKNDYDFYNEYSMSSKAGDWYIGDMALNYEYTDKSKNTGYIDVDLPIDNIDPVSYTVAVRLPLKLHIIVETYDELSVSADIEISSMPDEYISAETGNLTKFDSEENKKIVHKYITDNKGKIVKSIEKFIEDEIYNKIRSSGD